MKTKNWVLTTVLAASLTGSVTSVTAAAATTPKTSTTRAVAPSGVLTPRTDINPAVLYWQAFSLYPTLSEDVHRGFLGHPPSMAMADAEEASAEFDGTFRFLRRAARMKAPCDWGFDFSDGPSAIIPNLVKIRQCSQAAPARAHYALEAGRAQDAVDDLAAAFVLGRHAGTKGTLVTTMIGVAIEGMVIDFVAKNFHRFSPAALMDMMKQIDAAPPRPSVKQAMISERRLFLEWFIARIEAIRAAHTDAQGLTDERQAMKAARDMLVSGLEDEETVDKMIFKSGRTTAGLIAYVKEIGPLYHAVQTVAEANPAMLEEESRAFDEAREKHSNLLAGLTFPNVGRARNSELRVIVRLAMLRAAVALRVEGEDAFQKVPNPFGTGPFTLRRLPSDERGGEVGFELSSGVSAFGTSGSLKFLGDRPSGANPKVSFE